ncbi:THAP domain-containing protein 5-like isoform X2 [Brachyhypopomus gauderio]|uniref:THAP domain-containing protein 5-like isoform X2 n=1 Tax=Brachyhypopomus gauderio TaxID=698409 RepID=UPI0040413D1B
MQEQSFPLQDKARLKKWIVNMKRGDWTPSRHQYLCSEHFTEDSFDLRWGIRYLKHSAVPTIFPCVCDNETNHSKSKNKPRKRPPDPPVQLCALTNQPLDHPVSSVIRKKMPAVHTSVGSLLSETLSTESSTSGDLSNYGFPLTEERQQQQVDPSSVMTFLCHNTAGQFAGHEEELQEPQVAVSPSGMRIVLGDEERAHIEDGSPQQEAELPGDGEASSLGEHSYSRQDTDKAQLWRRIASLHAKVLALDKQEERTLSKIRSVEVEIEQLKRHNTVCQQRQKVLEEYFTSVFL